MKNRTKVSLIVMLSLIILVFTGCGSKEKAGDDKLPKEVKIGIIRVPNDKQVAISQNYFDEYFKDKGIKTKFMFFDSGVAANKALSSNSIDFAEMGYTNGVVALATDIPAELIWIHEVLGTNEALVTPKDSGITDIKQLKGKKIATPFSSTSHFSLLQALKLAGIEKDVTLLDMETNDIVAAWERGDLDAAYTWEPTLSTLKETGNVLIDSQTLAKEGFMTVNIDLVNTEFSKKYPELVEDYIKTLNKGVEYYKNNPEDAAKGAAKELGIETSDALEQMQGTTWLNMSEQVSTDYLGTEKNPGKFHDVFKDTAIFLNNQKSISSVPSEDDIHKFINTTYIEKAMEK
ncbi:taurine ABC transporter substrate-binding protein [Vagococcus martis]|uniref:Taurine ABC transporter substrate-binding protein n=1 Tax=Vagococcus martis TaxID=1768210 RepID=A0A1V4DFC3_9ENTE|nr:ABC transporter substrate-binding protein [Vagococcus martis]OPF87259.1 taurine ABC transporter substrate-binding protein [Vagococcus martis]